MLPAVQLAPPPYLGADPGGGIAEGEDGHVLSPAQPVHGDLGAGGPLDHGDVVLPESARCTVSGDQGPRRPETPAQPGHWANVGRVGF